MDRKRRFSRLGTKLVGVSVLGLALAFAVFYCVENMVMPWLFYSERFAAFWQSRSEKVIQEYQDYVTARDFTVQEVLEDREGELGTIASGVYTVMAGVPSAAAVLPDGDVGYTLTWAGLTEVEYTVPTDVEFVMEMHQIQCADGVLYVSTPPAALQYAGVGRVAGLLLALLGFCLVVVPYIIRLLRRISALSRETGVLMAGDLEHSIRVEGRDELSGLGEDIERLRRSVLERIQGEQKAVAANRSLITSMSHDLRTPLTKLTGYLDILAYHRYQTQEEHDSFLRLASEKAAQIKTLTDQMFAGAQVDAPRVPLTPEAELVDGAALLGQVLAEQCDDLGREGFVVRPPVFRQGFRLYLCTADVLRVFDNLFSNLRKYADPDYPIQIQVEDTPEAITLRLENRALPAPDRADSHGVGVPTMMELMSRSGGQLKASLSGGVYTSILIFRKGREPR